LEKDHTFGAKAVFPGMNWVNHVSH
jgi:hypothetical protein